MKFVISPPKETFNFNAKSFDLITNLLKVNYFQFRPKYTKLDDRKKFVKKYYNSFLEICKKKNIKMIINNDFKIAENFSFDGIHLGQKDRSCSDAKKKFGQKFIVGISCSDSYELYVNAKKEGADYVAFGPTFKTQNKRKKKIQFDKILSIKDKINLPYVLIGGINHSNIKNLNILNPNCVAIIDSLWNFNLGPVKSAFKYKEILEI